MEISRFSTLLTIAADSPAQLRSCDVFRVVEAAQNIGQLTAFCRWLTTLRPDLREEIDACQEEVG